MDTEDSSEQVEAEAMETSSHITRSVFEADVDSLLPGFSRTSKDVQGNYEFYDLDCETAMLVLKKPCSLHFYGSVSVRSLIGRAEILGYITDPSKPPVQVYSCEGSSALYVSTVDQDDENSDVDISVFSNYGVSLMEATKIGNLIKSGGCVLLLKEPERKRHVRKKTGRAERRFGLSLDTPRRCIANKVSIPALLQYDLNSGITVVCGGQGVGKSTSLRYLTNRTLNSVNKLLYLDLDVGQPEFTLHECVSALIVDKPIVGPSYTHFRKPLLSYNVGNIDVSRCVETYLQAVRLLVEKCLASYSDMPWLVNTMGFSKGVGVYITTSCLAILKPSLVIQIDGAKSQNFPSDLIVNNVRSFSGQTVPDYNFLKVIKKFKSGKDSYHSSSHSNKEVRWIATENYFSDELRPSYPLTIPAEFLQVFNVIDKSVIPVVQYPHLVSKLVILSSSNSLVEPPSMIDYGVILGYDVSEKVFTVLTPLEPGTDVMDIESILVGSLQIPSKVNKTTDPHTSGLVPYCHIRSGKTAPTVKPLKRTYRFLFEPSTRPHNDFQSLKPVS